ncbi:MAG: hypothetical protein C4335_07750 [Armatimonadota bacterium]
MSSHETLTELVEVLIDKTRDKRLMWELVGETDTYATVIDGSYTLRVYRDDDEVCLVLREMHSPEAITLFAHNQIDHERLELLHRVVRENALRYEEKIAQVVEILKAL